MWLSLARAPGLGPGGRRFESCHPEQRTLGLYMHTSLKSKLGAQERQSFFKIVYVFTRGCSSMVEHQPSKLDTWVRFPSPAFLLRKNAGDENLYYESATLHIRFEL